MSSSPLDDKLLRVKVKVPAIFTPRNHPASRELLSTRGDVLGAPHWAPIHGPLYLGPLSAREAGETPSTSKQPELTFIRPVHALRYMPHSHADAHGQAAFMGATDPWAVSPIHARPEVELPVPRSLSDLCALPPPNVSYSISSRRCQAPRHSSPMSLREHVPDSVSHRLSLEGRAVVQLRMSTSGNLSSTQTHMPAHADTSPLRPQLANTHSRNASDGTSILSLPQLAQLPRLAQSTSSLQWLLSQASSESSSKLSLSASIGYSCQGNHVKSATQPAIDKQHKMDGVRLPALPSRPGSTDGLHGASVLAQSATLSDAEREEEEEEEEEMEEDGLEEEEGEEEDDRGGDPDQNQVGDSKEGKVAEQEEDQDVCVKLSAHSTSSQEISAVINAVGHQPITTLSTAQSTTPYLWVHRAAQANNPWYPAPASTLSIARKLRFYTACLTAGQPAPPPPPVPGPGAAGSLRTSWKAPPKFYPTAVLSGNLPASQTLTQQQQQQQHILRTASSKPPRHAKPMAPSSNCSMTSPSPVLPPPAHPGPIPLACSKSLPPQPLINPDATSVPNPTSLPVNSALACAGRTHTALLPLTPCMVPMDTPIARLGPKATGIRASCTGEELPSITTANLAIDTTDPATATTTTTTNASGALEAALQMTSSLSCQLSSTISFLDGSPAFTDNAYFPAPPPTRAGPISSPGLCSLPSLRAKIYPLAPPPLAGSMDTSQFHAGLTQEGVALSNRRVSYDGDLLSRDVPAALLQKTLSTFVRACAPPTAVGAQASKRPAIIPGMQIQTTRNYHPHSDDLACIMAVKNINPHLPIDAQPTSSMNVEPPQHITPAQGHIRGGRVRPRVGPNEVLVRALGTEPTWTLDMPEVIGLDIGRALGGQTHRRNAGTLSPSPPSDPQPSRTLVSPQASSPPPSESPQPPDRLITRLSGGDGKGRAAGLTTRPSGGANGTITLAMYGEETVDGTSKPVGFTSRKLGLRRLAHADPRVLHKKASGPLVAGTPVLVMKGLHTGVL